MNNTFSSVVEILSEDSRPSLDKNFDLGSSKEFEAIGLPKWYHQLLATLYGKNLCSKTFSFYDFNELREEYTDAWNRPLKQMFLGGKYLGMGHYYVLGVFLDDLNDNPDCCAFFVETVGGSNGFDREHNYKQFISKQNENFNKLTIVEGINKICNNNPFI